MPIKLNKSFIKHKNRDNSKYHDKIAMLGLKIFVGVQTSRLRATSVILLLVLTFLPLNQLFRFVLHTCICKQWNKCSFDKQRKLQIYKQFAKLEYKYEDKYARKYKSALRTVPLTLHLCSRGRWWTNLSSLKEMLTKGLPLKTLLFTDEDQTDRCSGQRTV